MKKLQITKLSPTPLAIILAAFVLVCLPIRVLQLCTIVDAETGFWTTRNFTVLLLYIICAVFFLISFVFSYFSGVMTAPSFKKQSNITLGICSSLFAIAIAFETVMTGVDVADLVSTYLTSSNPNLYSYLVTTGGISLIFEVIFGIQAALYIVFVAISAFCGTADYMRHRVLALTPALWAVFRLTYHFIEPVSFRNVSQLFFEILLLCFASVFFMSFARIGAGINEESSMRAIWFAGTNAALYAAICGLAPIFALISGHGEVASDYCVNFADAGLALFIFTFLLTVTPLNNEVEE